MCDECDAVWKDKQLRDGPHFLTQPLLPCPGDNSPLRGQLAHWANQEEARQAGWNDVVVGESDALG
jgi:hypothetical protein